MHVSRLLMYFEYTEFFTERDRQYSPLAFSCYLTVFTSQAFRILCFCFKKQTVFENLHNGKYIL